MNGGGTQRASICFSGLLSRLSHRHMTAPFIEAFLYVSEIFLEMKKLLNGLRVDGNAVYRETSTPVMSLFHGCLLETLSFTDQKKNLLGKEATVVCNASSILLTILVHPALCLGNLTGINRINRISARSGPRLGSAKGELPGNQMKG